MKHTKPVLPTAAQLEELEDRKRELEFLRDRTNKKLLPASKRLRLLGEVYDGALHWLKETVLSGQAKGTAAATTVLERTRMEIEAIEKLEGLRTPEAQKIEVKIDYSALSTEDLARLREIKEKVKPK